MAWESDGGDDAARARELAIAKHDREASEFEEEYRTLTKNGYLATAFLLGREKIDRIVYRELSRHDRSARILGVGVEPGPDGGDQESRIRGVGVGAGIGDAPTGQRGESRGGHPGRIHHSPAIRRRNLRRGPCTGGPPLSPCRGQRDRLAGDAKGPAAGRHDHRHHGQPVADRRYWLYERLQARRASRGSIAVRAHCEFVTPGQVRRDLVRWGAGSVAIHGRLLLLLRWAYKASRSLGQVVARILNPVDDILCRIPGTAGLTGHLVVVVPP